MTADLLVRITFVAPFVIVVGMGVFAAFWRGRSQ
jgi:hypothetical protein